MVKVNLTKFDLSNDLNGYFPINIYAKSDHRLSLNIFKLVITSIFCYPFAGKLGAVCASF
jgi:hypothetical protein